MSAVVLVGLIGLWVAVLWPVWANRHRRLAHQASIARWNGALRVLSNRGKDGGVSRRAAAPFGLSATRLIVDTPTAPRRNAAARPAATARTPKAPAPARTPAQRRLMILQGLVGVFVVSLLLAVAVTSVFWVLALPSLAAAGVVLVLGRQVAAAEAARARSAAAGRRSAARDRHEAAVASAAPVFSVQRLAPTVAVLDDADDFVVVDRTSGWSRDTVLRESAPERDDPRLVPSAFAGHRVPVHSARVTGHTGPLFLQATGVDLDADPVEARDEDLDLVVARVLRRRTAS